MRIPIFDIENWKEIGATLARNKTRTFLTGFGIFWGVAMLAILMGGARGAEDLLRRNFQGFATNSCVAWPQRTTLPYKGNAKDRSWHFDIFDIERLRQALPELEVVTYKNLSDASNTMRHGRFSYAGNVEGVEPEFTKCFEPVIYAGRFINDSDIANERRVAVVGKKIINELYPGQDAPLGQMLEINGINYTIVGIQGQSNNINIGGTVDETVSIPASTFRRAYNRGITVNMCNLVARPGVKISQLEPRIRRILYSRHYINPADESAMDLFDISEEFEKVDSLFLGISWLALFIGISTLLAGVIGIGNIMWIIVKERTQEIGIRRAIGAKPLDIIIQILSEGIALTTIAGIAGISFATAALAIAQKLTASPDSPVARFQMSLPQALEIMAVFIILGSLAGLIPAIKAMRIKPVEAINDK